MHRYGVAGGWMKHFLIGVTVAITIAVIGPVWAQVPPPGPRLPGVQRYPFPRLAPGDAYREGRINRWELEQFEGLTPQALQGPSVDGSRAFQ
jgi:hypothetical protein